MVVDISTDQEFSEQLDYDDLVVVVFYSGASEPSRLVSQVIDGLDEEYEEVRFVKVNGIQFESLVKKFEVFTFPTVLYFKERSNEGRVTGANISAIKQAIAALL